MRSNLATKLVERTVLKPRRVNIHAVKSHSTEWRYPRPSRFGQWMLDWGYPMLAIFGAPLLVIAAIGGWLDGWLAPVFKMLGV